MSMRYLRTHNDYEDDSLAPIAEVGFIGIGFFSVIYWMVLMLTGDYLFVARQEEISGQIPELRLAILDMRVLVGLAMIYLPLGLVLLALIDDKAWKKKIRWLAGLAASIALFGLSIGFFVSMRDIAFARRRINEAEAVINTENEFVNDYLHVFLTIHLNCCFDEAERPELNCTALADEEPCISNEPLFEELDALVDFGDNLCSRDVKIRALRNRNDFFDRFLERNVLNDPNFCITGRRNYVRFLGRYYSNLTFHLMPISAMYGIAGLFISIGFIIIYFVETEGMLCTMTRAAPKTEEGPLNVYPLGETVKDDYL